MSGFSVAGYEIASVRSQFVDDADLAGHGMSGFKSVRIELAD